MSPLDLQKVPESSSSAGTSHHAPRHSIESTKNLEESVKHLQLVNILGSNDKDLVLSAILKLNSTHAPSNPPSYGSPLHLVVSLCEKSMIENVLAVFCSSTSSENLGSLGWINTQNSPDGETPLHIASKFGRPDIIQLLFQIPSIDDTIRNSSGKTASEVAKSESVASLFSKFRDDFSSGILTSILSYLNNNEAASIPVLFDNNLRAKSYLSVGWLDINAPLEQVMERSLLHLAAKSDDLELVNWALDHGADPGVKDKKGKKPSDLCKKDKVKDQLKSAISQAPIISASLAQATSATVQSAGTGPTEAPLLKGNLLKWVNYTTGYKSRYFVLENGSFSYYHAPEDYPLACRGSISTLSANVVLPDSNDKSRFDVIGSGNVKYSIKARSPADAKKWVWALMESRRWMTDIKHSGNGASHQPAESTSPIPEEGWDLNEDVIADPSILVKPPSSSLLGGDANSFLGNSPALTESILPLTEARLSIISQSHSQRPSVLFDSSHSVAASHAPTSNDVHALLFMLETQMQVQMRVVDLVSQSVREGGSGESLEQIPFILKNSIEQIQNTAGRIVELYDRREKYWHRRLNQEIERRKRWEDIVTKVVGVTDETQALSNLSLVPIPTDSRNSHRTVLSDDEDDVFYDAQDDALQNSDDFVESCFGFESIDSKPLSPRPPTVASFTARSPTIVLADGSIFPSYRELERSCFGYQSLLNFRTGLPLDPTKPKPALAVWSFLKSAIGKDLSKVTLPVFFNEPLSMLQRMCEDIEYIELLSLAGRAGRQGSLRGSIPLKTDPAVLAASQLGMDLKSVESLNETDAGLLRVMLVGAYAMSNYSSTVGRTNKPFNPMLGETFELVREDKAMRYLSEQVCHHPPISACFCESVDYSFWTEVNVKSKFWGKSLELHPLGNCHVSLPVYKKIHGSDSVEIVDSEHYSWKKVTTCVNNLIVGTLSIDHYGDMVVKNWRTGDECTVTFKQKESGGWFGGSVDPDPLTLGGNVKDKNGKIRFELRGKWDEYLEAIPVGHVEKTASMLTKPITLWKRNPMPPNAAQNFNFTSFALSLNETTPDLLQVLPPTDSRRRPDQSAMEKGEWEEANAGKERLETTQRKKRKEYVDTYNSTGKPSGPIRENRGIPIGEAWWTPRWFTREIDADTNEEHWLFTREYWKVRKNAEISYKWPDYVPDIYN